MPPERLLLPRLLLLVPVVTVLCVFSERDGVVYWLLRVAVASEGREYLEEPDTVEPWREEVEPLSKRELLLVPRLLVVVPLL